MDADECPFCAIAVGDAPATVIAEWPDAVAIVPHAPVAPGHWLVIPRVHVPDALADPGVTGATAARAAELAAAEGPDALNLITSVGTEATQTVRHLHWHLVPREAHDGLPLPWTPQQAARMALTSLVPERQRAARLEAVEEEHGPVVAVEAARDRWGELVDRAASAATVLLALGRVTVAALVPLEEAPLAGWSPLDRAAATVGVREARDRLADVLGRAAQGSAAVISRRGTPVAAVVPVLAINER